MGQYLNFTEQGECHIMTDVELGVVREGTSGPL